MPLFTYLPKDIALLICNCMFMLMYNENATHLVDRYADCIRARFKSDFDLHNTFEKYNDSACFLKNVMRIGCRHFVNGEIIFNEAVFDYLSEEEVLNIVDRYDLWSGISSNPAIFHDCKDRLFKILLRMRWTGEREESSRVHDFSVKKECPVLHFVRKRGKRKIREKRRRRKNRRREIAFQMRKEKKEQTC